MVLWVLCLIEERKALGDDENLNGRGRGVELSIVRVSLLLSDGCEVLNTLVSRLDVVLQ
jgi:hypothetical protein